MKNKNIANIILMLFVVIQAYSNEQKDYKPAYQPWYTGVLLATSASNASPGQLFIQPYFNALFRYGEFNANWKYSSIEHPQVILSPQLFLQWGLTNRIDFQMYPTMVTSIQNGQSETLFADLYTGIGFQILQDIPNSWVPNLRFVLEITFPTGKFDMGEIDRLATDFSGRGSYSIGGVFSIGKAFYYFPEHPFRITFNLGLTGFSDADVDGISIYGGIPETLGTVNSGANFFTYLTGEWSITQRWVFGLETYFAYSGRNEFIGKDFGVPFVFNEQMQFQIVPELEYNWSANLGIIGGVLYQFLGYNQNALTTLILSLVYSY